MGVVEQASVNLSLCNPISGLRSYGGILLLFEGETAGTVVLAAARTVAGPAVIELVDHLGLVE